MFDMEKKLGEKLAKAFEARAEEYHQSALKTTEDRHQKTVFFAVAMAMRESAQIIRKTTAD